MRAIVVVVVFVRVVMLTCRDTTRRPTIARSQRIVTMVVMVIMHIVSVDVVAAVIMSPAILAARDTPSTRAKAD